MLTGMNLVRAVMDLVSLNHDLTVRNKNLEAELAGLKSGLKIRTKTKTDPRPEPQPVPDDSVQNIQEGVNDLQRFRIGREME